MELNKIYCMDCIEGMKELEDKSVDLVLTDIPYDEVNSFQGANKLRKINKGNADILTFDLTEFLHQVNRICCGSIYIFCGINQVSYIRKSFVEFGLWTRHIIWHKPNPSPLNCQYIYLSDIENCVFGKNKKSTFNGKYVSSVFNITAGSSKIHPTQKPLELFEKIITLSSNEGDIVLDACVGSGTTAIACLKTQRRFIGFELEQKYVDIANKRIKPWLEQERLF